METLRLAASSQSPALARRFVASCLHRWGFGHRIDDAELLTSELVTNAVRYAGPPVLVQVDQAPDGVIVAVQDPEPALPTPRSAVPDELNGRGLAIVAALAADWGVDPVPDDGKAVWFRLAIPEPD